MERRFDEELKDLKQKLIRMGFLVEDGIEKAVRALFDRNVHAESVWEGEEKINRLEIEIDDIGRSLCALQQPMATDLRVVTSILKINTDLERMGDHAINIVERVSMLTESVPETIRVMLSEMAQVAKQMLRDSLVSFMDGDMDLAMTVLTRDDEVDDYNRRIYAELTRQMDRNASVARIGINVAMVSHNLERIADLANNIAEDVIYMKKGLEVRHHLEDQKSR